jgi:hypothetical protein
MLVALLPVPLPQPAVAAVSALLTCLVFIGWLRSLLQPASRLIAVYLLFYFGILLLWQTQWSSERFVVSIVPFLYFCLLRGIILVVFFVKALISRMAHPLKTLDDLAAAGTRLGKIALWVAVAIAVPINVWAGFRGAIQNNALSRDWVAYYDCADWVRSNTPPDAIIVSRKPELFYLRSNRQGLVYPFSHDIDRVVDFLKKNNVHYLVFDSFAWSQTTARYIYPVLISKPELFKTVYALKDPLTLVLEFTPGGGPGGQ